ncbi:peptidyl-prolyl cis-trans isomerase SurA [Paenimyroides aquimaris]|uniref:Peptidyl-prolyl cis-trans isomerase SurA n=1 Tax=Paenimyroides marinum TaxID=1159016 RepID=A0A1H6JYA0_9FLAO|nr:peptidylprolyl isomerase [Paenimyroides aquimaris]SEH67449.1 peptidyl-prolyl cis-trans isomerase SurA [Paenimyroides aquimaris]
MKIFLKHTLLTVLAVMGFVNMQAQESSKKRIDGVVGVVGSYVILDSDIDNGFIQAKATNQDVSTLSRCEVLGALLENKLFSHQAIQDSIVVTNDEVNARVDEQIDRMVEYAGSIDNVVKHYNKKSYEDFRETFFDIMKENLLASQMQQELIKDVTITPEEIRQFYNNIPKDSLPLVGDEIELAEIVIKPEITKEQRQAVIDQLNQIRQDVLDGASFTSKVYMYSEDRGSLETGGFYTIDKKSQFVKEFKDVAFSLKEGEISKPFETDFGYHIIFLEKISGKNLELRHILITPKPTQAAIDKAKNDLDDLRIRILNKEISFADAARQYSQDKDSRQSGGIMTNSRGETRFELNKMEDRTLYSMVSNLQVGEISATTLVNDRTESYYKIVQLTNKIPEHLADFSNDYMKIRYVALSAKQSETIAKWVSETVDDTYIYIDDEYQNCTFKSNWLKK